MKKQKMLSSLESINEHIFGDTRAVNSLRSNGRSKSPDDVNFLEIFYNECKADPKTFRITSSEITYYNWEQLREKLIEFYPDLTLVYNDTEYDIDRGIGYTNQEIWKLKEGVMLSLQGGLPNNMYIIDHELDGVAEICSNNLFLSKYAIQDAEKIGEMFRECRISKQDTISIGMVSFEDGNFYVKDFDIKAKAKELSSLDLHYGEGFEQYNEDIINRLTDVTKGLTLFHGKPGTGKTTYIRYLLKRLKEENNDNNILYFPPTMVDSIVEPSFINFISDWVADSKGKNYLLIEDAEPLLESRDNSRNIGITNLLNLTDGFLNDILDVQIIATFNTDIDNIDKALLRPERLAAMKNFKELSIESGKKLAVEIGVDPELITKVSSLADIYALKKGSKPIMHDVDEVGTGRIGFN